MDIELYAQKKDCCACGACYNICPKQAIVMQEDSEGFVYPHIDYSKCISCGACKRVCHFQRESEMHEPLKAYAAVNRIKEQLMKSASGGVFAAVASYVIEHGGVAIGATLCFENGHAIPRHTVVDNLDELTLVQGSKYVQSSIGHIYQETKEYLKLGKTVLFSGTPCQVAGLYGYLKGDAQNLITIDLICHGVSNARFFDDYLKTEKHRYHAKEIVGYSFRDKRRGWGMNGRIDMITKKNVIKSIYIPARLNSYNSLFLDGLTYRENCYECPYAKKTRVADLTIGDYWGIEVEHPDILGKNGFVERDGISCILANTEKGVQICKDVDELLAESESTFEKISHRNGQLKAPANRQDVMKIYSKDGYLAVDVWFKKKYWKHLAVHAAYNAIPRKIRIKLKSVLKK